MISWWRHHEEMKTADHRLFKHYGYGVMCMLCNSYSNHSRVNMTVVDGPVPILPQDMYNHHFDVGQYLECPKPPNKWLKIQHETDMSSFWQHHHHRLYRKFSRLQLRVQAVAQNDAISVSVTVAKDKLVVPKISWPNTISRWVWKLYSSRGFVIMIYTGA